MPFTERLACRLSLGVVFVALLTATAASWAGTPIPDPPARWLTDHAGFVSPAAGEEIDHRLADYARATGHQVLVYIDLTTGRVPIEDWAVKAFERWRVGRKGIDDGLVLFIFSTDRLVRIEVGYGLEPIMIDARASRIIRDLIVPRIRGGDRDGAVRLGVDAILNTLGGPGTPQMTGAVQPPVPVAHPSRFSPAEKRTLWIVALGFLAIPVLLLLLSGLVVLFFPGLARSLRTRSTSGQERAGSDAAAPSPSGSSSSSGDSDGFSGGGGRSGGGGASGSW